MRTALTRTRQATGVTLSVEDAGLGMSARTRERAMDDFYTTKATGSGLGLAFVRRVAEAHGGDVSLWSKEGAGTTVRLFLPLEIGGDMTMDVSDGGSVLVVDDDPAVGKVLAALLAQAGIGCSHVPGAGAALEALRRQPVDVVVTDLRMPGTTGLELLDEIAAALAGDPGHPADGARQRRRRRRRDEAGRGGLPAQAVRPRGDPVHGAQADRGRAPRRRAADADGRGGGQRRGSSSQDMREVQDLIRRAARGHGHRARARRERHRQGAGGARDPRQRPAPGRRRS